MGLSRIPRDTAFPVENHKFLPPRVFNAPLTGFPSEFCNGDGAPEKHNHTLPGGR